MRNIILAACPACAWDHTLTPKLKNNDGIWVWWVECKCGYKSSHAFTEREAKLLHNDEVRHGKK